MLSFDLSTLPQPLADYFAAADHRDTLSLFADDAVVRDEGSTHKGSAEIAAWLHRVQTSYQPHYQVQSLAGDAERPVVTFEVSGSFPGSPAVLRQAFSLRNGRIAGLETL